VILRLGSRWWKNHENKYICFHGTKAEKANEKWIKPVIILDEFQYLKNIIIDKENNLLLNEELFKFFIRLTKVNHLAHVICATSDSYYIEELYNHAKLKNTSKYFLVDHLEKKDIIGWLKSEDFEDEVIEYFWDHLWGSVWEIWQCLIDYKNTWDYKTPIQTMIDDEYAKISSRGDHGQNSRHKDQQRRKQNLKSHILTCHIFGSIPITYWRENSKIRLKVTDRVLKNLTEHSERLPKPKVRSSIISWQS